MDPNGSWGTMDPYRVGIAGATGLVGQRLLSLLDDHPWFRVTTLAAEEAETWVLEAGEHTLALPGILPFRRGDLVLGAATSAGLGAGARVVPAILAAAREPQA